MASAENRLIERLPRRDRLRLRLRSRCEPFESHLGAVLCDAGNVTRHAYFPVDGFFSLITPFDGKPALEVDMVGREGMLGAYLALGASTVPLHALVQGPGVAWRIGTPALRAELARSAALQRALNRYLYVQMAQLAGSAGCLRFHGIGPRLARWLLMSAPRPAGAGRPPRGSGKVAKPRFLESQDRAHADQFRVTQEFLAYMLGVRRVGVTAAAGILQRQGLIDYRRGAMVVLDRKRLESAACACYGIERRAYSDILG